MNYLDTKKIYQNVITADEAESLIEYGKKVNPFKDEDLNKLPIVKNVIQKIKNNLEVDIKHGWWWVKNHNAGIFPHYDTGSNKHNLWCNLSASILLSKPHTFIGGAVCFYDSLVEPLEHYLNCLVYSSREELALNKHWVEECIYGDRYVLLMFFEADFKTGERSRDKT